MDPIVGQLMLFAFNWYPAGFLPCDGRSLRISEYQALYSLLGIQFGGDTANFNLPDLRGRAPIHNGKGGGMTNTYAFAQKAGTETTQLTILNMPAHTHTGSVSLQGTGGFQVSNQPGTSNMPGSSMVLAGSTTNAVDAGGADASVNIYANYAAGTMVQLNNALNLQISGGGNFTTASTGGSQPVSNVSPVLAMTWAICVKGYYPQRPD